MHIYGKDLSQEHDEECISFLKEFGGAQYHLPFG